MLSISILQVRKKTRVFFRFCDKKGVIWEQLSAIKTNKSCKITQQKS